MLVPNAQRLAYSFYYYMIEKKRSIESKFLLSLGFPLNVLEDVFSDESKGMRPAIVRHFQE